MILGRPTRRHCEKRSDEAIQLSSEEKGWIASLTLARTTAAIQS
jgi:hypothetical protein